MKPIDILALLALALLALLLAVYLYSGLFAAHWNYYVVFLLIAGPAFTLAAKGVWYPKPVRWVAIRLSIGMLGVASRISL